MHKGLVMHTIFIMHKYKYKSKNFSRENDREVL